MHYYIVHLQNQVKIQYRIISEAVEFSPVICCIPCLVRFQYSSSHLTIAAELSRVAHMIDDLSRNPSESSCILVLHCTGTTVPVQLYRTVLVQVGNSYCSYWYMYEYKYRCCTSTVLVPVLLVYKYGTISYALIGSRMNRRIIPIRGPGEWTQYV